MEYSREEKTMERDKNVSPAEFKIRQYESSMLLLIKICHQFALVQISGGDAACLCPLSESRGFWN